MPWAAHPNRWMLMTARICRQCVNVSFDTRQRLVASMFDEPRTQARTKKRELRQQVKSEDELKSYSFPT